MSLIVNAIGVSCAMDFFVYCNQHFGHDFTRDQPEVNLFVTTIFRNQYEEYLINDVPKAFEDWFAVRNIHNDEAYVNVAKISRS